MYEIDQITSSSNDWNVLEEAENGSSDLMLEIVKRAQQFHKDNISELTKRFITAKWDMSRFTFGSIGKRIDISTKIIDRSNLNR